MRPSIRVIGDCRAKVRPDPLPPAIGCEGVVVCSGAFWFALYDAMLDHCRDARNWLMDRYWRIMFTGLRNWVLITAISYNQDTGAALQQSLLRNTSTRPVLTLAATCILLKPFPG